MCVYMCVCVCVFGIIRCEGGLASCQLSVDGRNIIKIIMSDLPHTMHSATYMHMRVLMDPTKLTYLRL